MLRACFQIQNHEQEDREVREEYFSILPELPGLPVQLLGRIMSSPVFFIAPGPSVAFSLFGNRGLSCPGHSPVAAFSATMSLLPFTSQLIADVGISLGDEGKGRLIPEVADELRDTRAPVSVVLKVNGGANSGHTAGGIKLNLLPAGVFVRDAGHPCIGRRVVAHP